MKKKQYKPKNEIFIYMLAVLIFIVPLIVFLKVDTLPKDLAEIIGTETYADLFAYYKAHVLQIGALIMFILAIGYRFYHEKSFKPDTFVWLLIAFAISILLSYAFSEHKEVALRGAFERYEGTLTWLAYVALSYSVYTFVEKKRDAYVLIGAFVMSATVVSLIGVFQYFGMDLFRTEFGKKLMLGSYYEQAASSLEFKMEKGRVYSTLYNPNYVGSMIALAFPLTVYLMDELRKKWVLVLGAIVIVLEMITLVGSRSAGGFFGVAFSVLLMAFYFAWRHSKRMALIPILSVMFLLSILVAYQVPYIKNNVHKVIYGFQDESYDDFPVKEIKVEDKILTFNLIDGTWFKVTPVDGTLDIETMNNTSIQKNQDEEKIKWEFNYNYYWIKIEHDLSKKKVTVYTYVPEINRMPSMSFDFWDMNRFAIRNKYVTNDNIESKYWRVIKNEKGLTVRGYIWNRTLPMIFEKPLFGFGPDTFVTHFEQVDVMGRSKIGFEYNIVVDKPHSLYLQLLFNFGVLGTLLFFINVLFFIKREQRFILSISVVAFFIVGFVNDSASYLTMMIFALMGLQMKKLDSRRLDK